MATRELYQGQSHQFIAVVRNADGKILQVPVTWASDNTDVARIDLHSGFAIAGTTAGSANITGSIGALTSAPDTLVNLGVRAITSQRVPPGTGTDTNPSIPPPLTFPPRVPSGPVDTNPSIPPPVTIFLGPPDAGTPQPPPLTIFDGGSGTGGNYLRESFDSGAWGPRLSNPSSLDVSVRQDPTPRNIGKVADVYLQNNPPIMPEAVRGLATNSLSRSNSTVTWFQAQFYIDSSNDVDRKLVVFSSPESSMQLIFGTQPFAAGLGQPFIQVDSATTISQAIGSPITLQAWNTVKIHIQLSAVPESADGTLEVWVNGALLYSNTAVQWGSLNRALDYFLTQFGFGYSVTSDSAVTEHHYWDNISIAFIESGL